ncbi:MAG: hypothetical protein H3C35_04340 [Bacteroidetes bacterium]|nr:hypothetical protein [Bacteroidota bacterium]
MKQKKIIIDSDVLFEHLVTRQPESLLRKVLKYYFCYTTVFNAVELFSAAQTKKELEAVGKAMQAIKILGLHAKSSKNIAGIVAEFQKKKKSELASLIAGVCMESRLPLLSLNPKRFAAVKGLKIISAQQMLKELR